MDEKDEVKRYDLADADQLELTPAQDGDYVKYSDYAALAERMKEAEVTVGWFCDLVKRASIGTAETPSLRAYVEQLEERLKMCEADNKLGVAVFSILLRHAGEAGYSEGAVDVVNRIIAERDTLKAENERLQTALEKCRLELWHCNEQLKSRGYREGHSVTEALQAAKDTLAKEQS